MIYFNWAFWRTVAWTGTAAAALGVLSLVVDSVESGARLGRIAEGAPWTSAVALALLHLPEMLVLQAPLVAALGSALAVAAACRSGEWQGVAASGLGPIARLMPVFFSGCLAAALALGLGEWVVPPAALAHARLEASLLALPGSDGKAGAGPGFALPESSGAWLALPGLVVHMNPRTPGWSPETPADHGFLLGPTTAWRIRQAALVSRWETEGLRWNGSSWLAVGEATVVSWPGSDQEAEAPWASIPPPSLLGTFLDGSAPSTRTLAALRRDPSPEARGELLSRVSRALCTAPLALVAGALPALLGPFPWVILVAVAPAVAAEMAGVVMAASASQGVGPAWLVLAVRMVVTLVAGAFLLRPLQKPGKAG